MVFKQSIQVWGVAGSLLICGFFLPAFAQAQYDDGADLPSTNPNQDTINQYNALRNDTVGRTGADTGYVSPSSPSNQDYANFYNNNSVTGGKTGSDITTGGKTGSSQGSSELVNPLKSKSIEEFLLKIIDVLLVFAVPIIVLYIMYAGYLFVTAQGEPGKVSAARQALLWSVVGGVIVLGAKIIITVIQGTITAF